MFMWTFVSLVFIIAATAAVILKGKNQSKYDGFYPVNNLRTVKGLFILFFTIGLTLGVAYVGDNPFIYFQF